MLAVLSLALVLVPGMAAVALLGHRSAVTLRLRQYIVVVAVAWLGAAISYYLLSLAVPKLGGNRAAFERPGEVWAFAASAFNCLPAFGIAAVVLYCWGEQWSREGHLIVATSIALSVSLLGVPLGLASACFIQGGCL